VAEKRYRVVCTRGHVYDVAVWLGSDNWLARMDGEMLWSGDDERAAVINACNEHIHIAEVRAPGELTTAEQVEAERSDLLSELRSLHANPPTMKELDLSQGGSDDMRTVWYEALERAIAKVEARRG
jgi:hypothetical protein